MVIQVKNLSKVYSIKSGGNSILKIFSKDIKKFTAVSDISFDIQKGEAVAFLGPNGAGKTTTMKMLTGLIYPTSGEIKVLGYSPFDRKPEFLSKIGLVMGNKSGLDWDLTPRQSFSLFQKIYNIPLEKFNNQVTLLTNLLSTQDFMDTQVRKLSLGERLKMEIAGSLLHSPEVLFLDEPTIGLDVISKQKVREFLKTIQTETGVTLLLTSHDMDDIEKVCDRVIVINRGQKVYDNTLKKLTDRYNKSRYIKVFFKTTPTSYKIDNSKIIEQREAMVEYKILNKNLSSFLSFITKEFDIADIDMASVPLEVIISDLFNKSSV
jgi:ABC-2 type transport system ATP-binding protein